jgi:hypothetical protein
MNTPVAPSRRHGSLLQIHAARFTYGVIDYALYPHSSARQSGQMWVSRATSVPGNGLPMIHRTSFTRAAHGASYTARPCGRNQNDENEHAPLVDDLCVETPCLCGPREMLQKMFAKKTRNYDLALQRRTRTRHALRRGSSDFILSNIERNCHPACGLEAPHKGRDYAALAILEVSHGPSNGGNPDIRQLISTPPAGNRCLGEGAGK